MPYQPTFPQPYLEAIDVANVNDFRCLINAKDTIIAYQINVYLSSTNTLIGYVRGDLDGTTQRKFWKKTADISETAITPNSTFLDTDSILPLKGSYSDDSWLIVEIPTELGLVNGNDYKWNITLHETNPSVKITNGYVQAYSSGTPSITIQANSNIQSGMYVKWNNQLKKIMTWNSSTKVATIESAFTGTPVLNDTYEIYTPFITSNDFFFKARTTPTIIYSPSAPTTITSNEYTFNLTYSQAQYIGVSYYIFDLYLDGEIIDSTGEIPSSNLTYAYQGFVNGKTYTLKPKVVTNDGVEIYEILDITFTVTYAQSSTYAIPVVTLDRDKTCVNIDYSKTISIDGNLEGNQTITLKKYENSDTTIPTTTNAISLNYNQDLYWNTINEVKSLEIPFDSTTILHNHFPIGHRGKIFELINENNTAETISIRVDYDGFYYSIGTSEEIYIDIYSGATVSGIIPSGDSTTVDITKLYIINSTDTILATDTIISNDLTHNYWWYIVVRPNAENDEDIVKVYKSVVYESEVIS